MKKLRLKESELIKLIERTINEQNPDVYWDCVNGNCEQGGTQFATEQECEESNCEERARPGGYGGKNDMSRIKARALSEQGSYDSERSLTHSEFMDEADMYCDENSEGRGQFTGNRSCKRCKGEQLIRAYCLGKKGENVKERELNEKQWCGDDATGGWCTDSQFCKCVGSNCGCEDMRIKKKK
tara:strand:- start:25 stop:573 length:549 start_codon:yes stop_codon:yes gene_type:complete